MRVTRLLILVTLLCMSASIAAKETIRIAVASNFIGPMKQIKQAYEKEHDTQLILAFGSSGKLYAQILHGAPYDVFLSADSEKPEKLVQNNLAQQGSQATYAKGKVVLLSRNIVDPKLALLAGDFNRVAVANPKLAPYGSAAIAVMQGIGAYSPDKLVKGENISQSYQFTITGHADLGFVAYSQVLANKALAQHQYWVVPTDLYEPIAQDLVVLAPSPAATSFVDFLLTQESQALIKTLGYE